MKRLKRLLTLVLCTVMITAALPCVTVSANQTTDGIMYEVYNDYVEITDYYGNATELDIPAKIEGLPVRSIAQNAFNGCNSIKTLIISDGVLKIGKHAFQDCFYIKDVKIPKSVTEIGGAAFGRCDSLERIDVDVDNEYYSSENGVLFDKSKQQLIRYPSGDKRTSYSIPNSVLYVAGWAFEYAENLDSVTIPNSVEVIAGDREVTEHGTFAWCHNLKKVILGIKVKNIPYSTFHDCTNLTDVYYAGDEEDRENIYIDSNNSDFSYATWHYNSKMLDERDKYISEIRPHIWLSVNGIDGTYLGIGDSFDSNISAYPGDAYPNKAVWHSTNPQVATVSQRGLITGVGEGRADVYVTTSDGMVSDSAKVIVTDFDKFKSCTPNTDKVLEIAKCKDSNYEWISDNNNFLYWKAFLANDTNGAKYFFQNYLCAPLFDMSEIKNFFGSPCSVKRAEEILLSFIDDSYDETFDTVKTNFLYKLGKRMGKDLAKYLENSYMPEAAEALNELGEDKIVKLIMKNASSADGYEKSISELAWIIGEDQSEATMRKINEWVAVDFMNTGISFLSDVIKFKNIVSDIGNEIILLETASRTNDMYRETLDYLADNCINANVQKAAKIISHRLGNVTNANIAEVVSETGVLIAIDKGIDWLAGKFKKEAFKANPAAKIGYELGISVSNSILHASDTLACADNIRLTSYISLALSENMNYMYSKALTETDPVMREEYATKMLYYYNTLAKARKIGEENYYKAYRYRSFDYIKDFLGLPNMTYAQWYEDTTKWLDSAKNNPERPKPTRQGGLYEDPSISNLNTVNYASYAVEPLSSGTSYTEEKFYSLFKDRELADAVLCSLGTSAENPDWSIVTDNTVNELTVLLCERDGNVTDLTGISNLPNLEYLDLSNQHIRTIPDEITTLTGLKAVNLFNNGLTEYPEILNQIPSLESVSMAYNLLTEFPSKAVSEIDVKGNLLDMSEYEEQRYLYSENPIITSTSDDLKSIIVVKDIYGTEYQYNGDGLYVDGVNAENASFNGTNAVVSVNNSENPNARLSVAVNICGDEAYTEEEFINTFPDEQLRAAVLDEFGMSDEVDYSKITPAALSKIWSLSTYEVADFSGIERLKGLKSLLAVGAYISEIPDEIISLKNLQSLSLEGSDIEDLNNIHKMDSLTELDISECIWLKNIQAVNDIPQLNALYADGLGIPDILEDIYDLSKLSKLSVKGNYIEDASPLKGQSFDFLDISGNYIDEKILEADFVPELSMNCPRLVCFPQINSLVTDIKVNGSTAVITLENTTGAVYNDISLIAATYDDGKMKECVTQNISLEVDEVKNIEVQFKDIGKEIRCFIWNNAKIMLPLSRKYVR